MTFGKLRTSYRYLAMASAAAKQAAVVAVACLILAIPSHAQEKESVASKINLTMEQRHVIKETIKDMKLQDTRAAGKLAVGDVVPQSVQLQAMPDPVAQRVSAVKSHQFFIQDGRIVLVDPSDHKVVEIIE